MINGVLREVMITPDRPEDSDSAGPRQATYLQRQSVVLRRAM